MSPVMIEGAPSQVYLELAAGGTIDREERDVWFWGIGWRWRAGGQVGKEGLNNNSIDVVPTAARAETLKKSG